MNKCYNWLVKKALGQVNALLLVIGLLVFSGVVAWWFYQNKEVVNVEDEKILASPTKTVVSSPIPTVDPMEGWQTYTSEDGCFSFKYPKEVEFKMQGDLAHLSIWGPSQKQDTEFYDGLSLGFLPIGAINMSLSDYVDSKIEESKQTGEIIQDKIGVTVNGISGFTYTVAGMGTFENIYMQSEDGSCGVEITNSTIDPTNQGYEKVVDDILSTFEFGK